MPIQAITFDFWGTLFRDVNLEERKLARTKALSSVAGVAEEEAAKALDEAYAEFFRIHVSEQRTLGPHDAVKLACATLKISLDTETSATLSEAFATAILEYSPEPIDQSLAAVQAAAAKYPVGLICDSGITPGSVLRVLLDRHGFTPHFGALTFSDELGVSKPQAPMFNQTAHALGVEAAGLFHIGDLDPTDIIGVHNVGGTAALFAAVNARFVETTKADYTFQHWREFLEQLPTLRAREQGAAQRR